MFRFQLERLNSRPVKCHAIAWFSRIFNAKMAQKCVTRKISICHANHAKWPMETKNRRKFQNCAHMVMCMEKIRWIFTHFHSFYWFFCGNITHFILFVVKITQFFKSQNIVHRGTFPYTCLTRWRMRGKYEHFRQTIFSKRLSLILPLTTWQAWNILSVHILYEYWAPYLLPVRVTDTWKWKNCFCQLWVMNP